MMNVVRRVGKICLLPSKEPFHRDRLNIFFNTFWTSELYSRVGLRVETQTALKNEERDRNKTHPIVDIKKIDKQLCYYWRTWLFASLGWQEIFNFSFQCPPSRIHFFVYFSLGCVTVSTIVLSIELKRKKQKLRNMTNYRLNCNYHSNYVKMSKFESQFQISTTTLAFEID